MTEENKTNTEEETMNEDVVCTEECKCEEAVTDEKVAEKKPSDKKEGSKFLNTLGGSLLDQIVSICASLVVFFLANNVVLKISGFRVKSEYKIAVFLIIYMVVNIFYKSICESTKLKSTVGKKIFK